MNRATEQTNEFFATGAATVGSGTLPHSGFSFRGLQRQLEGTVDHNGLSVSMGPQPLDGFFNRAMKRLADVVLSCVAIVGILSWLVPLMAIVIKINSPGPVFFLQRRNKRNGETFTCIKFRSMVVNKEADILPATENDARITSVGRFLRKYFIDEMPQFFNVLWGDMSVVGPRPHMISDNLRYSEMLNYYYCRHKVKPGITGLAQVMGYVGSTGETPQKMKDRVRLDIFYWRHWSYKLDLVILLRTLGRIVGL
jgi:putative colanic acid biosysnthesis UDP-glucose lipid carrier transferase